jgi:predicted small secreted protein
MKSENWRYAMRRIIFTTLMMLILLATNAACNTVHGFGQDVERAGEKTQDAADAVKKKL